MKRHRSGIGDSADALDSVRFKEDIKPKKVANSKVPNKITFEFEKSTFRCLSVSFSLILMATIVGFGFYSNIFDYNFEYEDNFGITPDILVLYEQYDRNGDRFIDLHEFEPLADRILNSKVIIHM